MTPGASAPASPTEPPEERQEVLVTLKLKTAGVARLRLPLIALTENLCLPAFTL